MRALRQSTWQVLCLSLTLTLVAGCGEDDPTQPAPPAVDHSELLVTNLSVALVKQATQTVHIDAHDTHGNPESFTATSGNAGIASISTTDTTLTVTGEDYGSTDIEVTSASGKTTIIPATVYNPQILETDELLITYAQTFFPPWHCNSNVPPTAFAWPVVTDGYRSVGPLCYVGADNPDGVRAVMVVKAKSGSDALASPIDYEFLWGADPTYDIGSFWKPVPPPGYKAMGVVAWEGYNKPFLDAVWCVREDLTVMGDPGTVPTDGLLNHPYHLYIWDIESPATGPHQNAYFSTGSFVCTYDPNPPGIDPVMNVLNVKLPMLAETPYQQYVPKLTEYDPPPGETVPILAREMLVPCTILKDPQYSGDLMWRITNSPFYRLERQVFYKLLYHNHNQTSIVQHNSYTRRSGVTTQESNEYWTETGISVSAEAGINISIISAKVSSNVSEALGYSTMTSISELEEEEYQSGVDVLPNKAVAIWQRYNRFVLKRHNGTSFEPVKAWEFGINSFVTDEYPDE